MSGEPNNPKRNVLARLLAAAMRQWRRLTFGGLVTALITFSIAVATNWEKAGTTACTVAALQPTLSDVCGAVGLGERPTHDERVFWETRHRGSCEDVRHYVDRVGQPQYHYRGAFLVEANALLAARRAGSHERFVPGTRLLSLYVMAAETAAANEAQSRAKTLALAQDQSDRACRAFAQTTLFRFASAGVDAQRWHCDPSGDGVACSLEGQSVCRLLERQSSETETCGR